MTSGKVTFWSATEKQVNLPRHLDWYMSSGENTNDPPVAESRSICKWFMVMCPLWLLCVASGQPVIAGWTASLARDIIALFLGWTMESASSLTFELFCGKRSAFISFAFRVLNRLHFCGWHLWISIDLALSARQWGKLVASQVVFKVVAIHEHLVNFQSDTGNSHTNASISRLSCLIQSHRT